MELCRKIPGLGPAEREGESMQQKENRDVRYDNQPEDEHYVRTIVNE
jgi:hypothetical protein